MSSLLINNNLHRDYLVDNPFDKFDISLLVKCDLKITKTEPDIFMYPKEINKINERVHHKSFSVSEDIIREINANHFNIKIDKLVIKYPNDYKVKFIQLYTPIKFIGQGSFGLVLSVIKKETKEKFAVKIIQKDYRYNSSSYLNEVALLKKFNHPRIMKLHEVIDTEDYLFLFVDLIEGGSLKDFIIERYNNNEDFFIKDSESAIIMKGVLEGVDYLHKNNVMHRDIKPENIMFKSKNDLNSLILCDFGIACEISSYTFSKSKCGTLLYIAPEMLFNRPYDHLVDLWSCGIILYILESGGSHPIFRKDMKKDKFIKEVKAKKQWTFSNSFPYIARNLFMKLCKHEPFFRYQTNKALHHPWITRKVNDSIPLTLSETYEKEDKIKSFKTLLISMIYINSYKNKYTIHYDNVLSTDNYSFNANDTRTERKKMMIKDGKNKIIELLLTPIKKDVFNSSRGFTSKLPRSNRNHTRISFFNTNTVKGSKTNIELPHYESQKNIIKIKIKKQKHLMIHSNKAESPTFLRLNKSPVHLMNRTLNKHNPSIDNTSPLILLKAIKTVREKEGTQIKKHKNSYIQIPSMFTQPGLGRLMTVQQSTVGN